MARGNFMQNSFLGGEWSPLSQGRSNEDAYYTGLNLCLNMIPLDNGPLVRRSGTRFAAHAKTHDGLINLIEFVSESGDALIVELTNLIARFYRNGILLVDASPPSVDNISSATPAVVTTAVAHGWSTGDTVVFQQLGGSGAAPLLNRQFTITVLSATTFSLAHTQPLSGSVDGTTLAGAALSPLQVARVTERALPYTGAQVSGVKYAEEADTLYLFHPAHEVRTIERTALVVAEPEPLDGPYLDENVTATTLTFSGTSGSITVTASSVAGINDGSGFQTTDIGRLIRINTGTVAAPAWSWLKITARTSTTVVTATVRGNNLGSASANTKWRLGVYSDTTGHPAHGAIHEGRLWLIGATGRVDGSKTFLFFNFEPTAADGTVADDNGVSAVFSGSGRQQPRWLHPIETGLLVGTDGGEYRVRASSFDDPITPFTIQVRLQSTYGAADVLPEYAGRNSVFVQSLGRSVYEYRFNGNGFLNANDIARDARHLTSKGVVDLAYVSEPTPILWALRGDGRLMASTYRFDNDDEQRIVAWHRHSITYDEDVTAGEDAATGTADPYLRGGQSTSTGDVYAIAVAPFSDAEGSRNDILWVAVLRGTTVCVEYVTPVFDETFIDNEAFFVDSGNLYRQEDFGITWVQDLTDATLYTFYGLDRLNGKTIDVTFRGVDLGTAVVSSGSVQVNLPEELNSVSSAYETSTATDAVGGTLSFASGFISSIEHDVVVRQKVFNPNEAFIVGEDGNLYYLAGPKVGDPLGIYLIDATDGSTIAASRDNTTIEADAAADGVEPPAGWIGGSPNAGNFAFGIPGTPYILVTIDDSFGVSTNHGYLYYKVNSAGAIEYLGGFAEAPVGLDWQFVPGDQFNNSTASMKAFGFFSPALTTDFRKNSPILLAGFAETKTLVVPLPSVQEVITNSPIQFASADNVENRSVNITTLFPSYAGLFGNGSSAEIPIVSSQGFMLPGRGRKVFLFAYVNQELMEEHAASTATVTVPALATQAAISTAPVIVEALITGLDHTDIRGIGINLNGGARFENFPFPDIGEGFSGAAGTSELNDYGNASVFPSDANDPKKPWFVFFPRRYPDSPDNTDKIGIRVYLWNPQTESATHLSFAKGQLYDVVADGLPATQDLSACISIYWDRTDNSLYVLSSGNVVSTSNDTIVSQFGTFVPSTGEIVSVNESHIDAILGCNYRSRFQLLRPDVGAGAQNGPGLAKKRRIDQFGLLAERTGTFLIGSDGFDDLLAVVMTEPDTLGRRPLFSGVHTDSLQGDHNYDNLISGEFRRPVPGAIAAISGFSNTSDR